MHLMLRSPKATIEQYQHWHYAWIVRTHTVQLLTRQNAHPSSVHYFCAQDHGKNTDWRDAKLVRWKQRARQRRNTGTEDKPEGRICPQASCFGLTELFHTLRLAYVFTLAIICLRISVIHGHNVEPYFPGMVQCSSLSLSHNWVSLKLAPWWLLTVNLFIQHDWIDSWCVNSIDRREQAVMEYYLITIAMGKSIASFYYGNWSCDVDINQSASSVVM